MINVLLLVFGLSQARALRRHHKQYFPFWGNRGKKPFVCCMQPWHGSSPILPQAKSMACRIFTCLLSELAYIGCVTWFETSEISFEWLCLINDMCSLFVFDCCHLCLPVWMTCALECRMCFENENVFRVLLKSLSEICKLFFTMWHGLRYWQQTAQLAKWVQATANFVQPMGFSVLAIEKNCKPSGKVSSWCLIQHYWLEESNDPGKSTENIQNMMRVATRLWHNFAVRIPC